MPKLVLNDLANLSNDNTVISTINDNNTAIEEAIDNTLSRDGSVPNQMESNLDMNGWHINNLPEPASDTDPVRLIDLTNVSQVTNVLHTASVTSNTIGLGNKTFTVPSGLGFFPGQYLLIQDTLNSANYMLGRVVSYSGTTLVFNSEVSAGSGTKTNWTIDLSGTPGVQGVIYDTVTNAIAATINPAVTFLNLQGYYTIGDGGNGLYKREVIMPADTGKFQSADGSWWHLISRDVTPEMFGCKGDSTTDDRANFQNCLDFVGVRSGGKVVLTPTKVYRIVLNVGVTDFGLIMKAKTTLSLNSATINLECAGPVYGIRVNNGCQILGPGTTACTVSTGLTPLVDQAIYQAPITIGSAYGDQGNFASINPYSQVADWEIRGVTVNSVRSTGLLVGGYGDVHNGVIAENIFPDQAFTTAPIGFDWAPLNTPGGETLTQLKTLYLANQFWTQHPHQIVIENNNIGRMTLPATPNFGSHGVRTSGCYNMTIRGNNIESVTYSGIFITGGDYGFEFAPAVQRLYACKGMIVENNILKQSAGDILGIWIDAFPDNVYAAFVGATYTPMYTVDGYETDSVIRNNTLAATSGSSTLPGIEIKFIRKLTVEGNYIQFFDRGISVLGSAKDIDILRNFVFFCDKAGIYLFDGSGTIQPMHCQVKDNWVKRNCTSGSTEGNIYMGNALYSTVDGNQIGSHDEDQSLYGLVVDTGCIGVTVTNNIVYEVKSTGTAYRFLQTADNTAIWVFRDNRYIAGANTYLTGPPIMPVRREYSVANPGIIITHAEAQRGAMLTDTTPSFGSWGRGSTILNVDAIGTGEGAWSICVATGTPGTWKRMITLP